MNVLADKKKRLVVLLRDTSATGARVLRQMKDIHHQAYKIRKECEYNLKCSLLDSGDSDIPSQRSSIGSIVSTLSYKHGPQYHINPSATATTVEPNRAAGVDLLNLHHVERRQRNQSYHQSSPGYGLPSDRSSTAHRSSSRHQKDFQAGARSSAHPGADTYGREEGDRSRREKTRDHAQPHDKDKLRSHHTRRDHASAMVPSPLGGGGSSAGASFPVSHPSTGSSSLAPNHDSGQSHLAHSVSNDTRSETSAPHRSKGTRGERQSRAPHPHHREELQDLEQGQPQLQQQHHHHNHHHHYKAADDHHTAERRGSESVAGDLESERLEERRRRRELREKQRERERDTVVQSATVAHVQGDNGSVVGGEKSHGGSEGSTGRGPRGEGFPDARLLNREEDERGAYREHRSKEHAADGRSSSRRDHRAGDGEALAKETATHARLMLRPDIQADHSDTASVATISSTRHRRRDADRVDYGHTTSPPTVVATTTTTTHAASGPAELASSQTRVASIAFSLYGNATSATPPSSSSSRGYGGSIPTPAFSSVPPSTTRSRGNGEVNYAPLPSQHTSSTAPSPPLAASTAASQVYATLSGLPGSSGSAAPATGRNTASTLSPSSSISSSSPSVHVPSSSQSNATTAAAATTTSLSASRRLSSASSATTTTTTTTSSSSRTSTAASHLVPAPYSLLGPAGANALPGDRAGSVAYAPPFLGADSLVLASTSPASRLGVVLGVRPGAGLGGGGAGATGTANSGPRVSSDNITAV